MKQLTIIALLLVSVLVSAQAIKMDVHLNDQSIESFDIDSIEKFEFTHTDTFPHYWIMYAQPPQHTDMEHHRFEVARTDMKLEEISFTKTLTITSGSSFDDASFRLVGGPAPLDSLYFRGYGFDTNVITLASPYFGCGVSGDYISTLWSGNTIYSTYPHKIHQIDTSLNITNATVPCPPRGESLIFDLNPDKNKLLEIDHEYISVRSSFLMEYDITKNTSTRLVPSDSFITAAQYLNADSIIYFTHGRSADKGEYILLNRISGERTRLLESDSNWWPHTFDLSDDRSKLLASCVHGKEPFFIEYSLPSMSADTIRPGFTSWSTTWVQYNSDASKILYNIYPPYCVFRSTGYSEIGIIDRKAPLIHKKPDVSVGSEGSWVSIFPRWSPDEKTIIFSTGSANNFPFEIHNFRMCILKSLD